MDNLSRPALLNATEPSESESDGETGMFWCVYFGNW